MEIWHDYQVRKELSFLFRSKNILISVSATAKVIPQLVTSDFLHQVASQGVVANEITMYLNSDTDANVIQDVNQFRDLQYKPEYV